MCTHSPKIEQPKPVAPVATPIDATNEDVSGEDVLRRNRKKKGASFLTRANDRGSILTAANDQAAQANKQTLG